MASYELFGFQFGKKEDPKKVAINIPSFTPPPNEDGALDLDLAQGGGYGSFIDMEGAAKNEAELITKYRDIALQPEVDTAIDEIVNESIIKQDNEESVSVNLDTVELPDKIKVRIEEEFKKVMNLLDFDNMGYDIFRRWYIDGRLYYHMMIDKTKPRDGLQEIRYVDPRRIKKVRKSIKTNPVNTGPNQQLSTPAYEEFYIYLQAGATGTNYNRGTKIAKDSIAFVHSGLLDSKNKFVLSHLQKAIKPMNQLRMLEDAVVIYRLARAPERRVFYIDVGNLPKMKAEQYLRDMMVRHKNRLVYDASTGEIRDDRKFMTMLEDFWLPRREGSKGTEITTLQGGQNLGQMEDVEYFKQKLYRSLKVPIMRLDETSNFSFGRTGEITRDEVKFAKFVDRLRNRFSHLFDIILETQLVLRGVMSREEFKKFKEDIHYDFKRDNYYAELKDQEIMNSRLGILQNADNYVGRYFPIDWVRRKVLMQTEEEIRDMDKKIEEEAQDPKNQAPADPNAEPPEEQMGWDPSGAQPQPMNPPKAPAGQPNSIGPIKDKKKEPPPKKATKNEVFIPREELSKEEKRLVENMTKLLEEVSADIRSDDVEVLSNVEEFDGE